MEYSLSSFGKTTLGNRLPGEDMGVTPNAYRQIQENTHIYTLSVYIFIYLYILY
jgi:hypothetical protein